MNSKMRINCLPTRLAEMTRQESLKFACLNFSRLDLHISSRYVTFYRMLVRNVRASFGVAQTCAGRVSMRKRAQHFSFRRALIGRSVAPTANKRAGNRRRRRKAKGGQKNFASPQSLIPTSLSRDSKKKNFMLCRDR